MGVVRILPDRVANQIAAGEVVERPVAVVKELVENSLDAGATQLSVTFRNGGKSLIQVEDNGCGMTRDDALLALERHATSKIENAEDLLRIASFGFRGEALPSIASVSKFTLRTRRERDTDGTEIVVSGGKLRHCRACGMPPGTFVEVSQLFNSVPARRKFLKTDGTEAAHITQVMRLLALANPSVGFTLTEGRRVSLRSPACKDIRERIGEVLSRKLSGDLMELDREADGLQLYALIGKPSVHRSTRTEIASFVNRRPVDSRALTYALLEACHTYIPRGRYPVGFLFLEIDPAAVDVNVHPAKREVRFRSEGSVRRFVMEALLDAFRENVRRMRPTSRTESAAPPSRAEPLGRPVPEFSAPRRTTPPAPAPPVQHRPGADAGEAPQGPASAPPTGEADPGPEPVATPGNGHVSWRFVGLLYARYGVFETDSGMILLNARAARERITFEEIRDKLARTDAATQQLLFPETIELDPVGAQVLQDHLDFFRENGFALEPFGGSTFRLVATPDWLEPSWADRFIRDLVTRIHDRGLRPEQTEAAREHIARLAATESARIPLPASADGLTRLAERLMQCRDPLTDPRGRATVCEIGKTELERRFGI